VQVSKTKV